MNGIRVFAVYLGLVWFFLGHASFLDKMDRAEREAELMEQAERDLELLEAEWTPRMSEVEDAVTEVKARIAEIAEEDEFSRLEAMAALELAEMALKARQEAKAAALTAAQNRIEQLEEEDLTLMDWLRAIGATLVGILLIAFAWRGPPLAWADVIQQKVDAVVPPSPTPDAAPAAPEASPPVASADADEIELDVEDPSDVG